MAAVKAVSIAFSGSDRMYMVDSEGRLWERDLLKPKWNLLTLPEGPNDTAEIRGKTA